MPKYRTSLDTMRTYDDLRAEKFGDWLAQQDDGTAKCSKCHVAFSDTTFEAQHTGMCLECSLPTSKD